MTLATKITASRLLAVPLLLYWLQSPTATEQWLALGIFLLAAGTDWLDGYVARRLNQVSDLGKFLDPLVDKLLVLAPLIALVELRVLPAWGVFLILARELAVAGWRVTPTLQAAGVPGANLWGKAKTGVQILAIALLLAPLPAPWPDIAQVSFWLAVVLTWVSGVVYLWPKSS
ncbi:CDP-diacylglycerol--glycerol-3-phosphate 3-phosphatidyltransferase [Halomicronema hongdechloris C2206]|uniref:CDP-diacylglycerol--glycerol-3-phosphate 3-phosphatidyltransferase n=1 Tax=Halomicronema hongdechloris C2206 TaxID=1641165 RepID=A0A1Z3HKM5_9CYAN|nr:CDP-diacylglycerol--glycerol-3-phosphate 3-phosphatidyltransferase [Halomicronema hongdechloris]ASC70872.1 CDP-diacylglycerol--glycerol-3-phosphate 3-phosphatidyltransferase [Halomicronema hongdechloris C2206]